jgi:hypothetical protein
VDYDMEFMEECERDFEKLVCEEEEKAVKQVYEEAEQLEGQSEYESDDDENTTARDKPGQLNGTTAP